MTGRNDNNKRCIISPSSSSELGALALQAGDYVRVRVKEASAQTLFCEPLEKSSIGEFYSTTSEERSKSQREAMMM